ncbi:MAG: hypothetical protein EON54_09115 [Alcaligenaceae bacterium]|nr:MAG: hypothetical protein EON54_09115 [Alcaligenaceae bacterium]
MALFERARGKLRPTPEATLLYAEVDQVYQSVQRVQRRAQDLKEGTGLSLRVLASPSTALELVPRAISALTLRFPTVRIYMETQLVREMVGQLVRHEADMAVSTLPVEHPLLSARAVGHWSFACVFAPDHRLAAQQRISLRDLRDERLIAFSADTPQGQLIARHWQDKGVHPNAQIEVRSGQVACALAACGAGVAIVDELTARAWDGPKLSHRPIRAAPTHKIFIVRPSSEPPSAAATAFHEEIEKAFHH